MKPYKKPRISKKLIKFNLFFNGPQFLNLFNATGLLAEGGGDCDCDTLDCAGDCPPGPFPDRCLSC